MIELAPLIAAGTGLVIGVPLAYTSARSAFARAARNTAAYKNVLSAIETFHEKNEIPVIQDPFRQVAVLLSDSLGSSRKMRDDAIERMQEMVGAPPQIHEFSDVRMVLEESAKSLKEILAKTGKEHVKFVFKHQVLKRLKESFTNPAVQDALAAAAIGAASFVASSDAEGLADAAATEAADGVHHGNPIDEKIVEILDSMGVIDATVAAVQSVEEGVHTVISSVFGDEIADKVLDFEHATLGVAMIPGVTILARAGFREVNMLWNDEITLGEAITEGMAPAAAHSGFLAFGIFIDSISLGTTFGLGSMAGYYAGRFVSKKILKDKAEDLANAYNGILNGLKQAHAEAMRIINETFGTHHNNFATKLGECPEMASTPTMRKYMDDLQYAYELGLVTTEEALANDIKAALNEVPPRSRMEKLLRLDTKGELELACDHSRRQITSRNLALVHHFALARDVHAQEAIKFLLKHGAFATHELQRSVYGMADATSAALNESKVELEEWETEVKSTWEEGAGNVAKVSDAEGQRYYEKVTDAKAILASISRKMDANKKRRGVKPA